jgi:hypothetical protein
MKITTKKEKEGIEEETEFINAIQAVGISGAVFDWILHCDDDDFLHLWGLMKQEHARYVRYIKDEKQKKRILKAS